MLTHFLDFGSTGIASGVRLLGTERYRTQGEQDFGPGTVISVWYRRQDLTTNNQVIVGGQDEIVQTGGTYVSERTWAIRAQTDGIGWVSYYRNTGIPGTVLANTWNTIIDRNWHHVLIRLESWSGAFPGTFVLRLYHDGVDQGTYTAGGPGTYFHDQAIYQSLVDLGYIYQSNGAGAYPTQAFTGDLAQVWIGTNNTFSIADYFDRGPVNLGPLGTSGAQRTLSEPGAYDRIDFPFESDSVMQNISTRSTRTPVVGDAADGIIYIDQDPSDTLIENSIPTSNFNVQPGRYEFGWDDITRNTYNTFTKINGSLIRVNQPGFYRVRMTGTIARNRNTPGNIIIELRSNYSSSGNYDTGTAVITTPRLLETNPPGTGPASVAVDIDQVVYLEGRLGLVYQVSWNYIEWSASTLNIEILTNPG